MKKLIRKCLVDSNNAFNKMLDSLDKHEKMLIVTLNPEGVMAALDDINLYKLYMQESTLLVCDSVAMRYAIKKVENKKIDYYPGIDLFNDLVKKMGNKRIYLYGAKENIVKSLYDKWTTEGFNICGYNNGYPNSDKEIDSRIKLIVKAKPDLIACALGVGKQELFCQRLMKDMDRGIFIGVGGSFDVLSGCKKRAPSFYRECRIEWLYRIIREPKRIKKFFNRNVKFIFLLMRLKYGKD